MRTATFPRTNSALILYRVIIDSEDLVEKCLKGISRRCEVDGDEMAQRDVDEKRPKPRPRPRKRRRRRRKRRIEEREKKE